MLRVIEYNGSRVTVMRTDDLVRITMTAGGDGYMVAGIVDGREVVLLDDGDEGVYSDVTLRNSQFAPVSEHGAPNVEYRISRVTLCNEVVGE